MGILVLFWAKIGQFDISESTRRILLKLCSLIWHNKTTKVICLKFPKKYLLGRNGQLARFGAKLHSLVSQFIQTEVKLGIIKTRYYFPKNPRFGANRHFGPV